MLNGTQTKVVSASEGDRGIGQTSRDIIKGWFPEPCALNAARGVTDGRTRHNLRQLTGEMKNIRLKNEDRKQDGQRSLGSF